MNIYRTKGGIPLYLHPIWTGIASLFSFNIPSNAELLGRSDAEAMQTDITALRNDMINVIESYHGR